MISDPLEASPGQLMRAGDAIAMGFAQRDIALKVSAGVWRRIRRGWFADAVWLDQLSVEQRHLVQTRAVLADATGDAVASHVSAAVIHGLPLYRLFPRRVHLAIGAAERVSSGNDVLRHYAPLDPRDVEWVNGAPVTSLARTVFDCIRTVSCEAAVAIADAAERSVRLRVAPGEDPSFAIAEHRARVSELIERSPGARGIRQARFVAEFADGQAQLPLESVSRLQLYRLGFRRVRLQVPVAGPGGTTYFADFALDDVQVLAEVDGRTKYLDAAMRGSRSAEQVVLDEKRREDWMRGVSGWPVVRWYAEDVLTPEALGARLSSFGIRLPGLPPRE